MRPRAWIVLLTGASLAALAAAAAPAAALPRFAARTGFDCRQCHVSPSGAALRTRYGSAVFQRLRLPLDIGGPAADEDGWAFSPRLTEWLTVGGDVRTAFLYSAPERSLDADPGTTSSFFLMQADLYTGATLGRHATVAFDIGVYSGFEAWVLLRASSEPSTLDAYLKVGRFVPAFGVRDANHDLYTRGGIGLGASDRDTGVELTGVAGPLTLSVALVNGTFGDELFDGHGSDHRSFEKALVSRLSLRLGGDHLHVQIGASAYVSDNAVQANPLFRPALGPTFDARQGVDEQRFGAHLMVGLGRLSYVGDVVYVANRFVDGPPFRLEGYASAQELGVQLVQGVELLGTFEFSEPNFSLASDASARVGGAVEVFLGPYFEVRAMVRHAFSDVAATGDVTDVVVFAHAAF